MPKKIVVRTGPKKEKYIPLEDEIISEEVVVPEEEESLQLLGQQISEARITKNLSLESLSKTGVRTMYCLKYFYVAWSAHTACFWNWKIQALLKKQTGF